MLKKIQPIYIVSISIVIIGFIILFSIHFFYELTTEVVMSFGAVLFAPLIAIVVGEYLRQRTERQKEEYEVLKALVSYRHEMGSQEFLGALNRVILVFDGNLKIKNLVKELWSGYVNRESSLVSKRRQIELIYAICVHMKRDVTEFEIDSFFINNPAPPILSMPLSSQNPNSTASDISDFITKTNSKSSGSITAGTFS